MRRILLPMVMVALALTAAPVAAQNMAEVPRGDSFSIENANECAPNAEVRATLSTPDGPDRVIGSSLADASGHFSLDASLPASTELGPASITVDCGLEDAVLDYDIEVVESTEIDYMEYAPFAAAGVGGLILLSLIVGWFRRRPKADKAAKATAKAEAKAAKVDAKATKTDAKKAKAEAKLAAKAAKSEVTDDDDDVTPNDDDADYWFWDNETGQGPVKRLACLSTEAFYLHEVPVDGFGDLLEQLDALGPDAALEQAFFSVPIAAIDEVHHRGTQLRFTFQRDGDKGAQVIDLGTEADGVIELLSRRVHVVSDAAVSTS